MSHRKHEDVSKGNESPEENSKSKQPARKSGKRTRGHTDELGDGRPSEKKARRENPNNEALKTDSKKGKSPAKKLSRRSRSSTGDDRRSRERKAQEGGSDEEQSTKKPTKSPTRKQSRRSRSSTSDDGRPHEKKGGSNESPVEKKPPSKKRQHSDSDGKEDEKLPKKKARIHVEPVPEDGSNKSKDERSRPVVSGKVNKVKLIPGMLGKKRIFSESDDQDEGSGQTGKKSHASASTSASGKDDETPEQLSTPGEKKVPSTKVLGKRERSDSDEKENGKPPEKRTALESVHVHVRSSRDDHTPEHLPTPVVETTGSKTTKPPPKLGKRSRGSTEGQGQEDEKPPPEKRGKAAPGMIKTVPASSRRRDSKPGDVMGKGNENGSRTATKKRAKSPEIFAHNLKVLRKKSAMRRKKLTKEVMVVKTIS